MTLSDFFVSAACFLAGAIVGIGSAIIANEKDPEILEDIAVIAKKKIANAEKKVHKAAKAAKVS